jgi:hypothetical protein
MADPVENAPMVTVQKLSFADTWVYRAIDKRENVGYILGNDSLQKARRDAKYLLKLGMIVHDPIPRGHAKWLKP